jgi:lysozyme family protein
MSIDTMIDAVLKREGGYVNHPDDAGGPTNYGITQATLAAWSGHPVTAADVAAMPESTARAIYQQSYFIGPGYDTISDPALQDLMFDFAVNSGPGAATKALQTSLQQMHLYPGVVDGQIGPQTRQALRGVTNWPELYFRVKCERYELYLRYIGRNPSQTVFATGWANRMDEFQGAA